MCLHDVHFCFRLLYDGSPCPIAKENKIDVVYDFINLIVLNLM